MPALLRLRDLLLSMATVPVLAALTLSLLVAAWMSRLRKGTQETTADEQLCEGTASVVIMSDGNAAQARNCLRSVISAVRHDGPGHEIILVGDTSLQPLVEQADGEPLLRFVLHSHALSAEQWVAGLEAATRGVVVFISSPMVVDVGFLHYLLSPFRSSETAAVAAGTLRSGVGKTAALTWRTGGEIQEGGVRLWRTISSTGDRSLTPALWTGREACAYKKTALVEAGGLDTVFTDSRVADADLGFRLWKRGWRLYQEPSCEVTHSSCSASTPAPFESDCEQADRLLFAWKNLEDSQSLLRFQSAFAANLLADALLGRLNLRPLRYALAKAATVIRHRLANPVAGVLSDEEVFRVSSHRYLLAAHDNQQKMNEAMAAGCSLAALQGTNNGRDVTQTHGRSGPLRILLVCPQLPYPPTHGAAVRMSNLLRVLAARHEVDLVSFHELNMSPDEVQASAARLREHCEVVRVVPRRPMSLCPRPFDRSIHIEQFDCQEMRETLLDMVDAGHYDLIQFDKTEMGQYALPEPAPAQVLVEHVLFYHAYRRQFLVPGRVSLARCIEYLKLRRYELATCRRFDGIVTMSGVDTAFLRTRLPSHRGIVDIPNGVDTEYYRFEPTDPGGRDILFIGNFDHSPNVDGIRYFLEQVFPKLKQRLPDLRLFIVGPGPYDSLQEVRSQPDVIATGFVEDTRPYLRGCVALIAPILAGSGTRLKILEAMSAGTAVVSTAVGVEGIDGVSGVHFLTADTPVAFANAVTGLIGNPSLRQGLRLKARRLIEDRYDWGIVGKRQEEFFLDLIERKRVCASRRVVRPLGG